MDRMKVPFAIPDCGEEEIQEVIQVIKSGWLTTASRCDRFEKDFAKFVGSENALAVNSATAALHLGLEALGIREGDIVIVPSFTFTATAEVVRYLNADPLFVDCDAETFCVTAEQIEKAIDAQSKRFESKRLKAIIPVHLGGHPCDMDSILSFAGDYKLKVLEDAAHALPTRYKDRLIGTFGDATCFSFYANKTMTTGEGGMLCTDDDGIAKRVRKMRLHGIDQDVWNRFSTGASWEYDVVAPGFKYNMPDVNAALGIHQLKKAENFRNKRQTIAETYFEKLKDIPGLILPRIHCSMEEHSWYLFNVMIDTEENSRVSGRDEFIKELAQRGIGTSVHYKPIHRMSYYKNRYGLNPEIFPNSEWIFQRCASLPIYSAMTEDQLDYVIKNIRDILL